MIDSSIKVITPGSSAGAITTRVAQLPRPLVFTNGCFDILHRGHVTYLQQARQLGAAMIVAVNTDESVKRQNKGDDRPVNSLEDRMAVLSALASIDAVVSFDQDTPLELIKLIRPNHLVKGGDWPVEKIVGHDIVSADGGEVHSIDFQFERSTSSLISKIRAAK